MTRSGMRTIGAMRSKSLNPDPVTTHTTDSSRSTRRLSTSFGSPAIVTAPLGSGHARPVVRVSHHERLR